MTAERPLGWDKLVAPPTFHSGGTLVDIADRNAERSRRRSADSTSSDALYQAMEGR